MALREDDILPDDELLMGCWPQVLQLEGVTWQQALIRIKLIVADVMWSEKSTSCILKFMVHCGILWNIVDTVWHCCFVRGSRCVRISSEHPSTVLEKFVEFLQDALEDDSEDDDEWPLQTRCWRGKQLRCQVWKWCSPPAMAVWNREHKVGQLAVRCEEGQFPQTMLPYNMITVIDYRHLDNFRLLPSECYYDGEDETGQRSTIKCRSEVGGALLRLLCCSLVCACVC